MTPVPLLLIGAGGHARACIDVVEAHGGFTIVGLVGSADEVGRDVLGYRVVGDDASIESLRDMADDALVVVGQIKTPDLRMRLADRLSKGGWRSPTIVSPRAHVSRHATVGGGTVVMHGAVVNAAAAVGRHCILNSQSLVEHDAIIGDFCHVSTNAAINSGVRVGDGTFLGSGCSVRQGIRIGARCVIGMGAAVRQDCEDGSQYPTRGAA